MNYRRVFEEYYKIKVPEEYDIHHLDLNHDNNDIDNLLLLPHDLHSRYHITVGLLLQASPEPTSFEEMTVPFGLRIHGNELSTASLLENYISQMIDILDECAVWMDYRLFMQGKLWNIHNIEL